MSFLGDLVNSIGTNKAPIHPRPTPRPPTTSSAAQPQSVPLPKALASLPTPPIAGSKRKLDDRDSVDSRAPKPPERPVKASQISSNSIPKVSQQSTSQVQDVVKISAARSVVPRTTTNATPATSSIPNKPAAKGSYAQMIARAKEAQQTRTSNPLGTIKHQATSKEKVSKLAERRRQEQEKSKSGRDKKAGKSASSTKPDRKRGESPVKKSEQVKVPRAPRPPLHAPQSSYKGTMGTAAKKALPERGPRRHRNDEYLGTDEEDNSEIDDYGDEDDGYGYSDESSDMEAGLDDIASEERLALRAAMVDDAKELALDNQLKREKEERRRKLEAMAKKSR